MGLLSTILTFPLAPIRAVMALGEVIQRRVDEELRDPASVRRELEEIDRSHRAGEISDEEASRRQQQVLDRMTSPPTGTGTSERT